MCISFCGGLLTPHPILATTMAVGAADRVSRRDMEVSPSAVMNNQVPTGGSAGSGTKLISHP